MSGLNVLGLPSVHGDQGLARVRYVVHGTANSGDSVHFAESGVVFTPGHRIFSTSLVHAHDGAIDRTNQGTSPGVGGTMGRVLVWSIPPELHLGYGVFTSAIIDRQAKVVGGSPLLYAGARKHLSLYFGEDVEAERLRVEGEAGFTRSMQLQPGVVLQGRYLVGSFASDGGMVALMAQLNAQAHSLEPIDFLRYESALRELLSVREPAEAVVSPVAIRNLLIGTVESIVMSRLRMMRWQGLQLRGYMFKEFDSVITVASVQDEREQRVALDEFARNLASSALFDGDLVWLKVYGTNQLDLMYHELDPA